MYSSTRCMSTCPHHHHARATGKSHGKKRGVQQQGCATCNPEMNGKGGVLELVPGESGLGGGKDDVAGEALRSGIQIRTRVCFQPLTRLSSFSYLHQRKCVSFQSFCLCVSIRTFDLHLGTFYTPGKPRFVSPCLIHQFSEDNESDSLSVASEMTVPS